ncbi:MAG TPA: hypothetical protein VMV60_01675, partial [Thermoanaerobaculia bacterium]|nr:hypothetical protein [Thermoanaerobaculia bacterium]
GYSTPDYVQGTTAGLPFTITPFIPAFTVNGSATGPVSLQVNQALTVANSSQRGSGVTGSYSYDLCLSPCTATYSGTTGGVFTGMTDPTNTSGTPPSSATLAAPPTAGTYTLRLRISYAGGTSYWPDPSGVGGVTVTVTNPPPPIVVTAFATPNPANSGDVIQFSCSATGGSGTFSSYQWFDQSGNNFRSTQNFSMSISNGGPGLMTLPVTCTVTDSNGGTGSASFTETVRPPPPVVTVRATPNPVANGGTVQLACSATGGSGTFTYSWSNGAGTFSSAQSPAITASNPSPTAITSPTTCTVTDTNGSQASATVNLTINGAIPIVVTATVAPGTAYAGDTVQFRCSATGGTGNFVSYSWSTSAGTFATTQSPTMKVANAGNSPIVSVDTCTVTDSMAGVGTGTATLTVNPASGPYSFYVLTPCRVLDTRNAAGALGGPSLQAAGAPDRSFPVLTSACGIPANAKSLSVNVTVTNVTAAGDLSFYRGDGQETGTSTASLMVGRTRANNAMVQLALDGSGTIAVQNTSAGTVDVIVDVNGYFR